MRLKCFYRVKNTWHQTLQKSLTKETELFESSEDGQMFALREHDLSAVGPGHEALKQVFHVASKFPCLSNS